MMQMARLKECLCRKAKVYYGKAERFPAVRAGCPALGLFSSARTGSKDAHAIE
jgi:hypothetical protein